MTISVKEIRELKDYLVNVYHRNRLKEQEIDQTYIDDTFNVPFIKEGVTAVRTGKGYRMVAAPAEHIITNNPQVFRKFYKKGEADATARVASELNRWCKIMLHQNPQPFKEFVKKLLGFGEAWIYLSHNNDFDKADVNDMPIDFSILSPLIVFSDRGEKNGIPSRLVISYQRIVSDIKFNYPYWTWKNQKPGMNVKEKVPFFMYFDDEIRYFEADEQALLTELNGKLANGDGIQENIYGVVSFVHAYSGFGEGASDGDPANLAFSRLRKVRDLIGEYTAIRSTINSIIFRYAHKSIDLIYPSEGPEPKGDIGENYSREPNAFNIVGLPSGGEIKPAEDMLPDQQLFQHLYNISAEIDKEDPLGTIAQAIGTSGRQQDIAQESALRRYDTIVENCANAFATAFGLGLKIIEKLPNNMLLPSGLKEGDIGGNYECTLELKAEDPIEQDRLRTLGSRLYQQGEIDLQTNLTKYQGYTEEETQNIMARILVDNATRNNPIIAAVMGQQAAREIGMEEEYEAIKTQNEMTEMMPPPVPKTGSQGGEPREGNIKTPMGQEMMDMALTQRGQRRSPER